MTWLIYGANGYTGELIARLAVRRGERPVLAGRSGGRIAPLAAELGLEQRTFGLDDPAALRRGLAGAAVVAHCAGPFSATALQMAAACCDAGAHYLDITGEIDVFEQLRGLQAQAEAAGVVLLPGIGFDVVPTDCLAVTVAAALPGAGALDLAFLPGSGPSSGTARTAVAMLRTGGRARIDGVITPVRVGWKSLTAEFPSGQKKVSSVPWGDVSTAYYSTGIPTITTYTPTPAGGSAATALLRFGPAAAIADALARRVPGPGPASRARGHAEVWARASHGSRAATATMTTPNPYDLTADSVVRAAVRLAAQPPGASGPTAVSGPASGSGPADVSEPAADSGPAVVPVVLAGVHTPATAFGSGYAATLDGVVQGPVQITS
jgi:short subunit dehydrogenase-like uncharacterized protein